MVRLIQALNKAGMDKEERDQNIEEGYSTMEEEMVWFYLLQFLTVFIMFQFFYTTAKIFGHQLHVEQKLKKYGNEKF